MGSQHAEDNTFTPFSFAVIADMHFSERQGMARFDRFVEILDARGGVAFMLVLGDLIWTGPMEQLRALLERVEIPVHVFYGNNDANRLDEYEATFGPRDRTFEHGGCLFVMFWNCMPEDSPQNHMGDISEAQWQWLDTELAAAEERGLRHVFLASHVPPTCPNGYYPGFYLCEQAERRFWALCDRHEVTACFFGHLHQDDVFGHGDTEVIITPSLNWNFAPPVGTGAEVGKAWEIVDEGFFRIVQVRAGGISHSLVPVNLPDESCRPPT